MSQTLTSPVLNRGRKVQMSLLEESETRDSVWRVRVISPDGTSDSSVVLRGYSKAWRHYCDLKAIWQRPEPTEPSVLAQAMAEHEAECTDPYCGNCV